MANPGIHHGSWRGAARRAARTWAAASMCAACAWAQAQSLPPIPRAATPSKAGQAGAPTLPMAVQDPPLLSPGPKDLPKADKPCSALPEKGVDWTAAALGTLQAQSLRPGGLPKARDAYAELWIFFLAARARGYDMDSYSNKVEALYIGLYPSGPFAPSSPFEKFKEPRKGCRKSP